jgi:hypothetical protein
MENMNLKELSQIELIETNGGESLWYWVAYGVGASVRFLTTPSDSSYINAKVGTP